MEFFCYGNTRSSAHDYKNANLLILRFQFWDLTCTLRQHIIGTLTVFSMFVSLLLHKWHWYIYIWNRTRVRVNEYTTIFHLDSLFYSSMLRKYMTGECSLSSHQQDACCSSTKLICRHIHCTHILIVLPKVRSARRIDVSGPLPHK